MSQIILMSIRPEWVAKILNGEKTEEIRKNVGKLVPPFKVVCYCTKNGFPLVAGYSGVEENEKPEYMDMRHLPPCCGYHLNGKVVCEFVCDRMEAIYNGVDNCRTDAGTEAYCELKTSSMDNFQLRKASCLTSGQLESYCDYENRDKYVNRDCSVYSLHIAQLKVYDNPRELGEFYKRLHYPNGMWIDKNICVDKKDCDEFRVTKAPQSWCYVEY